MGDHTRAQIGSLGFLSHPLTDRYCSYLRGRAQQPRPKALVVTVPTENSDGREGVSWHIYSSHNTTAISGQRRWVLANSSSLCA